MNATVDIVIPVLNEEVALPGCIEKLYAFTADYPERDWRVVVADNGSTDRTTVIAEELSGKYKTLSVSRLDQRGRGRALKKAWSESDADVRLYMDVDLSTDINAIPKLVAAIADDGYEIAIGSRLAKGSEVVDRTLKREITSRGYNILIHLFFPLTKFKDAQCGFKAIRTDAARALLPVVEDTGWFFDSELLLVAQHNGYRLHEVPVKWIDDPDSRVNIIKTATGDLKGLWRLRRGGIPSAVR